MLNIFGMQLRLPRFGKLTEGKWFNSMCQKSFAEVDVDSDGRLDYKELYIGLLRLYDLLNARLPCRIKVPNMEDVSKMMRKYDVDASGKIELSEYVTLCKALVGSRKDWKESLVVKVAVVVTLKMFGFPYAGGAIKAGLLALGVNDIEKVPTGVLTYAVEAVTKQITS